ncbi:MAG: serine/threonine-protein kinase, partial [Pirellulaceae bacterium]
MIHREMDLRAAAGESIDPFEYRHRFPDHQGVMETAFSRLKKLGGDSTPNPNLATRQADSKSSVEKNTDEGIRDHLVSTRADDIPERLGVYRIGRKLGSGGFGVVHLAEDTSTGQQLALKFPRRQQIRTPEEFAGFRREADAASGLQHPGIVRTYGVFEVEGYIFIAQQYVGGGSLKVLRDSSVSQRRIAEIIAQVSEALAYAHQQGITHRDLKPSNILLDFDANPLIADFGLAIHDSAQRRVKGERSGTPHYMSPEQVNGLAHLLDGQSDIWSLGVIMYELLVGRQPFQGAIRDELFEEIIGRDPRPPRMIRPQVDRELQRICLKCLQKAIRERYNTADELTQDLRAWLSGQSAGISRSGTIPVVPRGLHSFGSHDSDFFQRLLPGPKDQRGLAEITRFWKSQIEAPRGRSGFRVGVIIGPSGCGKSSYVKAGLLPFLDNQRVDTLFVEATSDDTEARLEKKLRAAHPSLPQGIALPRMLDLIRDELRSEGQRKLLIVIDQFEQWLHARPATAKTGLHQALQHTNGDNLQCILLVRDDFWLRLSQFLHDMEIDFQEGTNAWRFDLFDKRHAQQVLHEFGLAFGKLPELDQELTPDQTQFLQQAIESIAEEERIVCVRLALFAEMFRNRPWT